MGEASLEELSKVQVHSASKHLQPSREAPSAVTVITADDIQKFGFRTLGEALRSVRGFYTTNDRTYAYLGVRGFQRPGDYNSRILLLVDGHRINDKIYDQAAIGTEFPLDIDLVERIEVIRGPSSSLYGSNAVFGVINVITRKPEQVASPEISFEAGSFGTYKGRISYGLQSRGVGALLSGSFYDSSGQNLFFPILDDPSSNNGLARNADYDRYHDWFLSLAWRNFRLRGVDSSRDKAIPTAPYGSTFSDPRTHSVDQHQYLDLSSEYKVGQATLDIRTYYDRYAYDAEWPYSPDAINKDYARGQRWGAEFQFSRTVPVKHHLTFGSELRYNFQQEQKNYDVNPPLVYVTETSCPTSATSARN